MMQGSVDFVQNTSSDFSSNGEVAIRPLMIDLHTHILPKNWPDLKKKYGYGGWINMENMPGVSRV